MNYVMLLKVGQVQGISEVGDHAVIRCFIGVACIAKNIRYSADCVRENAIFAAVIVENHFV